MTEEEYELLGKHLEVCDPAFGHFCSTEGFKIQGKSVTGRYPRKRLMKYGSPNYFIDLWMDDDVNGKPYHEYFPDIPYSLAAGAWCDKNGIRYTHRFIKFSGRPFSQMKNHIASELESVVEELYQFDQDYIFREGKQTSLIKDK